MQVSKGNVVRHSLHTPLCDLLGVKYPIIQAGMGGSNIRGYVGNPELVAAVSEAGGFGVMGGGHLSVEDFLKSLRLTRSLTRKPFGVNLMFPGGDALQRGNPEELEAQVPAECRKFTLEILAKLGLPPAKKRPVAPHIYLTREVSLRKLEIALEDKVPVLVYSLGDPGPEAVRTAHTAGAKVIGLAGTSRQAARLKSQGIDIVVAVGYEAGGHGGYVGSMALVPQVVDAVRPLPVVAGGGISDGRGVVAALALGAAGAWIGTRFMVSTECNAAPWLKDLALRANESSTTKSKFASGKPNRHLRSPWDDAWEESGRKPLPMPLQGLAFWDYLAAVNEAGKYEFSGELLGQGAGLIKQMKPAGTIVRELIEEALKVAGELPGINGAQRRGSGRHKLFAEQ